DATAQVLGKVAVKFGTDRARLLTQIDSDRVSRGGRANPAARGENSGGRAGAKKPAASQQVSHMATTVSLADGARNRLRPVELLRHPFLKRPHVLRTPQKVLHQIVGR